MVVKNKALFLDRDGVINYDYGYLIDKNKIKIIPEIKKIIMYYKRQSYKIIVISNQACIGKKLISRKAINTLNSVINNELGDSINQFYVCPHILEDGCSCRKPEPALILEAIKEHNINPNLSYFIGDKVTDITAASSVGIKFGYLKITNEVLTLKKLNLSWTLLHS